MLEEMMNEIIKKYGLEAKETIQFCNDCEKGKKQMASIIEKIEKKYQYLKEKV